MLNWLATGQWRREQVEVEEAPSTWAVPAEAREQIEREWAVAVGRPGVQLFDGAMVRWEGLEASGERLRMRVSRTSYKLFWGTNMRHPEWADRYRPVVLANPVGLSAALVSREGWLLLGRRNARVAYYPNRLHPFAGALEPAEMRDPFAGIQRELGEELELTPSDVSDIICLGVVEDRALRQGEMIFRVAVDLEAEAIVSRLDGVEHHSALAIRPERSAIDDLLERPGELTPVGIATVLLWARGFLGEAWFEDRRRSCQLPVAGCPWPDPPRS